MAVLKNAHNTGMTGSEIDNALNIAGEGYSREEVDNLLSDKANVDNLSAVATSGSYSDLSDKPVTDLEPIEDSANAVQSGGVYARLSAINLNSVKKCND